MYNTSEEGDCMYSYEIEKFLQERNYCVTPQECNILMDVNTNTQITNMKYYCANNKYHISTNDGYNFIFTVR